MRHVAIWRNNGVIISSLKMWNDNIITTTKCVVLA